MTAPAAVDGSARQGLSTDEAARRLAAYGRNDLGPPKRRSLARRVLAQLRDPLILVLLAAAVLTVLVGDVEDTAVILLVVVVNSTIGVAQEVKADKAIAALTGMSAPTARLLRDARQVVVPAAEVVPGDVVLLHAGDVVPADARLVESPALQVDESALTGESVPVDKEAGADKVSEEQLTSPGEVFAGTVVTRGRALGVVTATGRKSALGRIAGMLAGAHAGLTPLQRRLAGLGRVLAVVAAVLSTVVMVSGIVRGQDLELMIVTAVSLVVAAVPESLPAVATLSLALGARRMAARNAIVRQLPAVETLGSVTVLATDKTGTLTEGRMVAERLWTTRWEGRVTGTGYAPDGEIVASGGEPTAALPAEVYDLLRTGCLCSDARLVPPGGPGEEWAAIGDPTEAALLALAAKGGIDVEGLLEHCPRLHELPFDSVRKRMTTVHACTATPAGSAGQDGGGMGGWAGGRYLVACKGAPDVVLRPALLADEPGVLERARVHAETLAAEGYRVLAVAARWHDEAPRLPGEADRLEQGLRLLGLVALADPPRPAAEQAVRSLREAGVVPVLVTGDHPATARAIAGRLGVLEPGRGVATGAELARDAREGVEIPGVDGTRVYARTTPDQKLDLVTAWQAHGHVVAMTGDGVNDGPALRKADIGVAMGRRGTEVAKQAADLVLADDDLGTVAAAVEEGRRVYANVRRFLRYGMSGGTAEILVMLLGPLFGMTVPLLPAQILWVNLLTHGLPGVALGAEPGEPGAMRQPPRSPAESVLGAGLWQQVLALGTVLTVVTLGIGVWVYETGGPWQTMMFVALGLGQLGVALGLRAGSGLSNPFLLWAVALAAVLQVGVVWWGPTQELLGVESLSLSGLLVGLSAAAVGFVGARVLRLLSAPGRLRRGVAAH